MPTMDSHGKAVSIPVTMSNRYDVLVLGGTAEANQLADVLARRGVAAVLSYAGRTENPKQPPIPFRVGGFGGVEGLVRYILDHRIRVVIDATHPFAAQMSTNAVEAIAETGVKLIALERPPWIEAPGDKWLRVPSLEAAANALGKAPRRVFLGIGRMHLDVFASAPQHAYLVRLIDPPRGKLPLPHLSVVVARGPFTFANDKALFEERRIDVVVAKNSGGAAAEAKILAARKLGLQVVMVDRPAIPARPSVTTIEDVLAVLATEVRLPEPVVSPSTSALPAKQPMRRW
jgi:precorrin-6A/cobalt-precorrin-6A reductase